ncbi:hypothetical protein EZ428_17275 [Pedobacter frigiditerrae]|uniref:Lipoprotein n=1 Tax=Pedobacter frigiditerrae TaxID=2530452 RepID=A0A4R0MRT7_9SPHI|nr:hypothetical protein [Pedobacter frigiditerrae]TCC89443.1 hypothetical protein EZ428_17275 [Pedobacter frigiditerrae]
MKKLIYFVMAVVLIACSEKRKGADSKIFIEKEVSNFSETNPQWTKNVNNEADVTDKYKRKMINLSNEPNFLTDFPLQLTAISDTTVSDQPVKIATFKSFKDAARPKESLLNDLELEIKGIITAEQAANLTIDKKYTLKGMIYKQGKRADVKFFHGGETPVYTLGKYTFWNIEAKAL